MPTKDLYDAGYLSHQQGRICWGREQEYEQGGGVTPAQLAMSNLVNIPALGPVPSVFVIDLEIIDKSTGLPPFELLGGAGFRINFGTPQDSRIRKFLPGIHALIASSLRIDCVIPSVFGVAPVVYTYRASCTVQDGVLPTYSWVL